MNCQLNTNSQHFLTRPILNKLFFHTKKLIYSIVSFKYAPEKNLIFIFFFLLHYIFYKGKKKKRRKTKNEKRKNKKQKQKRFL